MEDRRTRRLRSTLDAMHLLRLHRLLGRWTQGSGVVFTLHHVRPWSGAAFAPNSLLEITPDFLDRTLQFLREQDVEVVTLDEAAARLRSGSSQRFAAITFDDGYRDVRDFALPILRRHSAPATLFVTSAFADGTGDLWWLRLEQAIAASGVVRFDFGAGEEALPAATPQEKAKAWERVYWTLRTLDEACMRAKIDGLVRRAGIDTAALTASLCMTWDELREVARDPLVAIGNHTMTHPRLGKLAAEEVRREVAGAQARIVAELGRAPRHLAYPVGDPTSAGSREFKVAKELGFETAWTTRLGVLFPEHAAHLTALPRVSLNGHYQDRRYLETFVSGVPFALRNRLRRLDVA
jgi:peptidoglycan/xylan/chitin deacetylase (PgdA/CDA1 family)